MGYCFSYFDFKGCMMFVVGLYDCFEGIGGCFESKSDYFGHFNNGFGEVEFDDFDFWGLG